MSGILMHTTTQMEQWGGEFGKNYTDRNTFSFEEMEQLYKKNFGITRTQLNRRFVDNLDRSIRILEIGSNVGNQLTCLQKIGFTNLYGIELQRYAVEQSKIRTKNIDIIQGSAFDIPYKDNYFDLVFTSGVLIHISPSDIHKALNEIYRCTQQYIWGFEYYSDKYKTVNYRGHEELLWKTNFASLYIDTCPQLSLVKEEKIPYLTNEHVDTMFLLQKMSI